MIKTEERGRGMSSEETEMVQKAEGSLKLKFSDKEDAMYVKEEVGPCLELFPR